MPFRKSKYLTGHRVYGITSKSDTRLYPSSYEELQSICNNDVTLASTSNEDISETEERHNKIDIRYSNIKNNNTCDNTSVNLNTHDKSYVHKSILPIQSDLKDFVDIEINDQISASMEQINRGRTNVKSEANSENEVSKCFNKSIELSMPTTYSRKKLLSSIKWEKLETSSVETEDTNALSISRDSDTIRHNLCREDLYLVNKKNVPDKNKRYSQQSKINDCNVSNHFSLLTHDNILKDQEIKEIENGAIALPVKPTRLLPLDTKTFTENNSEKESRLVKDEFKLPNSMQSSIESISLESTADHGRIYDRAADNLQLTEKCTSNKQEISSPKGKNTQSITSEVMNENNDLQNEAVHQNVCTASTASEMNTKIEQNQLFVMPTVKRKRGRPRKIIDDSMEKGMPNKAIDNNVSREIPDSIAESVTRDKRRASQIKITDINDLSDESDVAEDTTLVRKRGRPPGSRGRGRRRGRGRGRGTSQNSLDTEYIPRLTAKDSSQLRTKKSSDIDDTDVSTSHIADIENAATNSTAPKIKEIELVTCAKCDQEMPKKQWYSHNLNKHNNMAWKNNETPLDFENDVRLLKRVLTSVLKQKKKFLICEKCETAIRSVNGFISHLQFCGKSEQERQALMVTCAICDAVMKPSSVEVHERNHRQLEESKKKEAEMQMERTKRKAAEKAIPKIMELAESLREKNQDTVKNIPIHNVAIQIPKSKTISSVWKVMWKNELASKGIASCKLIGCNFTCSSYETICEHYYQCDFTPQEDFMCTICKFSADSKDKIVNHITEAHTSNNDVENSDYEMEEDEYSSDESTSDYSIKRRLRPRTLKMSSDSTSQEPAQNLHSTEIYKPALGWALDFEQKNYELALFKDDMPNCFTLLKDNDAAAYLPELTISMAFKHGGSSENNTDNNWKHMNRFESDIYEDVPVFFVGGPIWALAWLPIPAPMYSKNPTQYIAISTHPTMESKYTVGGAYSEPNIIQIWDVGPLDNDGNRSPVLAYAIAHNSGTVWCLEWCPSGCYQDIDLGNYKADENKLKRMGLLAAACSDGCINIYSLPFADELKFEKTEDNSWPIYKTDPVITLVVNILMYDANKQNWQCTKLSWTKEHGHDIIAAGFTNGYIGLWRLTTTSPFLLTVRENTKFIDTFQHFFAHHNSITMVALVPRGKSRFLASGSMDKSYKFWDLEHTGAPQNCLKKGIVANGAWMTHWACAVISFDDAIGRHYMHTSVVPVREFRYKYCPILASNSPTYSLAVSDYTNGITHGTLGGEVMSVFLHKLLDADKMLPKKRQLNSFIEMVDFLEEQQPSKVNESEDEKREYHYMPETYNECKDRFGIIFHNNLMDLKKLRGKQRDILNNDKLISFPIEQYPFTSVNRMAWNPNAWSFLWLAIGYQNGLVRLLRFNSKSTIREMNAQLPAHVESMLAKRERVD